MIFTKSPERKVTSSTLLLIANGKYKDHRVGQLTRLPPTLPFSRWMSVMIKPDLPSLHLGLDLTASGALSHYGSLKVVAHRYSL